MKSRLALFFAILFFSAAAYAQDYKKHKVGKGETVTDVAKKYKVTPYDIYRLNPDSKNGLKENMVLLIPTGTPAPAAPVKEKPTELVNTVHELQEGETLYSISKKYNVTVEQLEKANPGLAIDDLQIGQKLIIPIKGSPVKEQVKKAEKADAKKDVDAYIYHKVAAGETKYSIARDYDITLQLLEELNPDVKDILPLGYELKLVNRKVVNNKPVSAAPVADSIYMLYEVPAKETMYNITKKTGLTEEQLIALNPELKEGLKEGMQLRIPKAGAGVAAPLKKTKADLTLTLKKDEEKNLALLIPFNLARVEQDTVRAQLLRNDKFLNMTLDFYAGALVAIDSAEALGLPLKVNIYDSKETSRSSEIASLKNRLMGADAVIGPFFTGNAENAASLLTDVPVVSPLSKESGKKYPNLFQSVPSPDTAKKALFDYLKAQNANVIAVIDPKKVSSKEYIKANYPSIKIVATGEGAINEAAIKANLVKSGKNYVILETERSAMVINTIRILADAKSEYQIQLAVPEINDVFDNNEVSLARLTALKMMYPSVTNDSDTEGERMFIKMFREKNGYAPNQFATRGFDVTFDVILRLFQQKPFAEVMDTTASEQVENKFSYRKENGGYSNTAVYIMQYGDEYTVTEAPAVPVDVTAQQSKPTEKP
ncbi:LysM peptidoglycan-binding domain-containing protein [Flavobacterium sp. D11R37]|uniref:PBP1 and LysM peptidoglycan-binding domain-containing protein n=1 Tax=Flavobacterium coralii TaxID=2838017 RepID=UPI001CA6DC10|nr:LysM peptidoglycan-binding domain-containing protein [Flavobacterium coralii]MBY8963583.1 LysM peptidoglycan-binding domain-containing protein [Flavobacterium coralii]